jgi:hypothetical protein
MLCAVLMLLCTAGVAHAAATLVNGGLELDADGDGVPNCFQKAGYGTNTSSLARTSDAHSGAWAERLTVSALSSGDRKLLTLQDGGTCAPAVSGGQKYVLGAWYKATATTKVVAYVRTSAGAWSYWATSPAFAASSGYVRALWTTPALPTGTTALAFGLNLAQTGTLTTDDYSVSAVDTSAPQTTITAQPSATTTATSAAFSFTSSDAGSTFRCTVDGVSGACTSPKSVSGLQLGTHSFSVAATNSSGVSDATPASYGWSVQAPVTPTPTATPTASPTPTPTASPTPTPTAATFTETWNAPWGGYGALWGNASWLTPGSPGMWHGDSGDSYLYSVADGARTVGSTETHTNSQRWYTHVAFPGATQRVGIDFKPLNWDSTAAGRSSWAGFKLWLRRDKDVYESGMYLIEPMIHDGSIHIQKKCWGITDTTNPLSVDTGAGGTYYLLKKLSGVPVPLGAWHHFEGVASDNADGSVSLTLIRDGQTIATVKDTVGLTGCAPFRGTGFVGLRSDALGWHADDFTVSDR